MVKVTGSPALRGPIAPITARPATARDEPLCCPFVISRDHQENRAGWTFQGFRADRDEHYRPLLIPVEDVHLKTGDYSIRGLEDRIAEERKSHSDLYGSLAGKDSERRDRLEAEHQRMAEMVRNGGSACLIIEAPLEIVETGWEETLGNPPEGSGLNPKVVLRTWRSWKEKYGIEWIWAGGRRQAEIVCFRTLEKFWERWADQV